MTPLSTSGTARPFMPKCVVVDPNFDWHGQDVLSEVRVPFDDTIIYELHVKGFTKCFPGHGGAPARHLRGAGRRRRWSSTSSSWA